MTALSPPKEYVYSSPIRFERKRARRFRECQVPTQEQADHSEIRFKHRKAKAAAKNRALFRLEVDFVVLTDHLPSGTEQDRRVVHHAFHFVLDDHAESQVSLVPLRASAERFSRKARYLLCQFGKAHATFVAGRRELGEDDQVHLLRGADVIDDLADAVEVCLRLVQARMELRNRDECFSHESSHSDFSASAIRDAPIANGSVNRF